MTQRTNDDTYRPEFFSYMFFFRHCNYYSRITISFTPYTVLMIFLRLGPTVSSLLYFFHFFCHPYSLRCPCHYRIEAWKLQKRRSPRTVIQESKATTRFTRSGTVRGEKEPTDRWKKKKRERRAYYDFRACGAEGLELLRFGVQGVTYKVGWSRKKR